MQSLTFFYLFPAIAFLVVGANWLINRSPGIFGWIPVVSCYATCAAILLLGGCQRKAHVALTAVEVDLGTLDQIRPIMIGGPPDDPLRQEAPAFEIPGYPYDALRLVRLNEDLRIVPGKGYDSTVVVRSGNKIVPVTESGPFLFHLADSDQIQVETQSEIARWTLGSGSAQLTPATEPAVRWVGANGQGVAGSALLPESTLSLSLASSGELILRRGPGFPGHAVVRVNDAVLPTGQDEWRVPYVDGSTLLELVQLDNLAGTAKVDRSLGGASLDWRSARAKHPEKMFQTATFADNENVTLGGGAEDRIRVFGLPPKCFELSVSSNNKLLIKLSKPVAEQIENGEGLYIDHRLPESFLKFREGVVISQDSEWQLGGKSSSTGGILRFRIESDPASDALASLPSEVSGDLAPVEPVSGRSVRLIWLGNLVTNWKLPNRTITLPMFPDRPFSLITRRKWSQAAYPLKRVSPYSSQVVSSLFSNLQNEAIDSLSLLQTNPGISVLRNGNSLRPANRERALGVLEPGGEIAFLQLALTKTGPATAFDERGMTEITRLATRDRFRAFRLEKRVHGKESRPVLKVEFFKPEVQSIPMGEIKRGKKLAASQDQSVSFGVNEVSGFSSEPYQVRFRALTPFFRKANAKVVLGHKIVAQDDYRTSETNYGSEFSIGQRDRLHLQVTKHTIPVRTIFWLAVGGLVSVVGVFLRWTSLAWNSLFFGVAFLTCSRLLFAQAAMVNAPYNFDAQEMAILAIVALPMLMVAFVILLPFFLPGRIHSFLDRWKNGTPFQILLGIAFVIFVVRALLLAVGFKESIGAGGVRLALSIGTVPLHIIILALGCARLFAERRRLGAFDLPLIGRFFGFVVVVLIFQFATALMVSDVGLFLYIIPQVIMVAIIGAAIVFECVAKFRNPKADQLELASRSVISLLLVLPLIGMVWAFSAPKALYSAPFLAGILATDDEIATGSTELRILQFINKDYLIKLGTDTAERIAQDHSIMENYARRGLVGEGFLQVDVIHAKRNTSLNDNVSAVFIFAQFGIVGALAVMVAYLAVLLSSIGVSRKLSGPTGWAAVLAALTFALTSLYMMAANYGFLPFTGRNMYLLGLDSGSDLAESAALLFLIALGLAHFEFVEKIRKDPENA